MDTLDSGTANWFSNMAEGGREREREVWLGGGGGGVKAWMKPAI